MKYNILKFITNTKDQYSASIGATFDDLNKAKVNYHQALASLHNADDVKIASVKIEDEYGGQVAGYYEFVNHEETETANE